jgi:hypothetical protein
VIIEIGPVIIRSAVGSNILSKLFCENNQPVPQVDKLPTIAKIPVSRKNQAKL